MAQAISRLRTLAILVAMAMAGHAQDFGGRYNGDNTGYEVASGVDREGRATANFSNRTLLIAHAVLATMAFGFFLPVGSILIRLGSFRGLWLVHGLFQLFAYAVYVAAAALGIYMIRTGPAMLIQDPHPIIGLVLLGLLFFQPFLGFIHHFRFKAKGRRTISSYGHLWIGRIAITLGIINGGLGLRLARRFPLAPPSTAHIIGYSVAAGFMWLLYVLSVIIGERRRSRVQGIRKEEPVAKDIDTASQNTAKVEYA